MCDRSLCFQHFSFLGDFLCPEDELWNISLLRCFKDEPPKTPMCYHHNPKKLSQYKCIYIALREKSQIA